MTHTIDAIYTAGVLKPLEALPLREQQRVRVTIETPECGQGNGRELALERLVDRLRRSTLSYGGPHPTREELHERDRHL